MTILQSVCLVYKISKAVGFGAVPYSFFQEKVKYRRRYLTFWYTAMALLNAVIFGLRLYHSINNVESEDFDVWFGDVIKMTISFASVYSIIIFSLFYGVRKVFKVLKKIKKLEGRVKIDQIPTFTNDYVVVCIITLEVLYLITATVNVWAIFYFPQDQIPLNVSYLVENFVFDLFAKQLELHFIYISYVTGRLIGGFNESLKLMTTRKTSPWCGLAGTHAKLVHLCTEVNQAYSGVALTLVTMRFLEILFIGNLLMTGEDQSKEALEMAFTVLSIITIGGALILLGAVGSFVQLKVIQTAHHLDPYLIESKSADVKEEMIGAVTTYLVILLQFQTPSTKQSTTPAPCAPIE